MAKFDLLANSIADAKQLKKAATATAKLTLEEAFQPSLQRMISSKLAEEDELEEEDAEVDIDFNLEGSDEPDGDEGGGEGFASFDDDGGDDEEGMDDEGSEDDLELEQLMRELDGDDEYMDENDEFMDDEDELGEGEEDSWSDPIETVDEDDEYSEPSEDDVIESILRELDDDGMEDDGMGLDENEDGAGAYEETAPIGTMNQEGFRRKAKRLQVENKKLKTQVNQAMRAITILKSAINETNLLNAKLMFTTKTLRAYPLTESQQARIVDSFDRAKSVREVKLVYTTVMESFNKKPTTKKRVTEGIASKTVKAVNPSKNDRRKQNLNESSDVLRWKQLAGLTQIDW